MNTRNGWKKALMKYWQMYLLLIPVIVYYIIFKYVPMAGVQIAFKDFKFRRGIWGSAWVGMEHGPDEGVSEADLKRALKIYIVTIARLMELDLA